jgi:hypothetical protein
MAKTIIEFSSSDDVMGIIRLWTLENGFEIIERKDDNYRLYMKKGGVLHVGAKYWLQVDRNNSDYTLTAWVKYLHKEMALDTGLLSNYPFHGEIPPFRKLINNLLRILELQKI